MWCVRLLMFFLLIGGSWRHVRCTCVLESEFGFTLNCAFKKSGLFRVRNLGGIKAHVGLGFTVGDELGFPESLSNLESNRRRSTQTNGFQNVLLQQENAKKNAVHQQNNKINVRQSPQLSSIPQPKLQPKPQSQPQPKPQHPHQPQPQTQIILGTLASKMSTKTGHSMVDLPVMNVPPFKRIPVAAERPSTNRIESMNSAIKSSVPTSAMMGIAVSTFHGMPSSISRISSGNTVLMKTPSFPVTSHAITDDSEAKNKLNSNNLALRTLSTASLEFPGALPHFSMNNIQALAANSNITVEAIELAIRERQQQLLKQQQQQYSSTTTTHRPTTVPPKRQQIGSSKVMNAPREYYPVGYDKNFDDNFASRVELPNTSFYCGNQKHFPGLYADEDLGCMVFHVCALTDDGLIMKSFLCPESTLFDQTILKCNWWFYVDCKNSKKLYDSNIPISKSYQLMKALTFFSSYKRDQVSTTPAVLKTSTNKE